MNRKSQDEAGFPPCVMLSEVETSISYKLPTLHFVGFAKQAQDEERLCCRGRNDIVSSFFQNNAKYI